ncbi:DUF4339 domain-containing protein [Rhodobacteraceae bacterium RKSG542]|uniref:DUF4339 domain-containing protein n=1 Tax=Pseudovibrio flavus TaxID=2529854 RepID=UPI0012BBF8F0|nr:DUF4339 domain-containing protein [Pseudovibrio flavus]MTI17717.1 DUF4339 domain-containing protein [Pseudovibrio flavus]
MQHGEGTTQWFYKHDREKCGPVDDGAMKRLIARGVVTAQTKVWHYQLGPVWKRAGEIAFLKQLLIEVGPADKGKAYQVSQFILWLMIFTPLISTLMAISLGSIIPLPVPELKEFMTPIYFVIAFPFISAGFYYIDRRALLSVYTKAVPLGYLIFLFLPPVYFLLRKQTEIHQGYLAPLVSLLLLPAPFVLFYFVL